jgi:hypothetical protein
MVDALQHCGSDYPVCRSYILRINEAAMDGNVSFINARSKWEAIWIPFTQHQQVLSENDDICHTWHAAEDEDNMLRVHVRELEATPQPNDFPSWKWHEPVARSP